MSACHRRSRLVILFLLSSLISNFAFGQWWNIKSLIFGSKEKRAETLLVTGNYVKSRMLAELFQLETKQPVLLLPGTKNRGPMYFLSPEKSVEINAEDFVRFVTFLKPKKVVFMGDESHVSSKYIDTLGDRLPVWSIRNGDWEKIAYSIGEMFGIKHMLNDFLVLIYQLDESGSIKAPASTENFGGFSTNSDGWTPGGADAE